MSKSICPACQENLHAGRITLCSPCERYASQDHVSQAEVPLSNVFIDQSFDAAEKIEPRSARDEELRAVVRHFRSAQLTPRQREVLWRRFVRSLTFSDIADELGMSKASVHRTYQRGLMRLRRQG